METLVIPFAAAAGGLIAGAVAFATLWLTVGSKIGGVNSRADNADRKAEAAAALAAAANARHDTLSSELARHREDVAQKLGRLEALVETSSRAIADAENRLAGSIEDMAKQFADMGRRLDRLFERIADGSGGGSHHRERA